ncbi:MAG: inositol monophosphatase [Chloroflexota bacterium]|nr:inositol monophosphatase [Chloroflexota bacterium]
MTASQREQWLTTAKEIAQEAGELVMRYYRAEVAVHIKGEDARNLVTDADLAAEESISEALRAAYPDHAILSEEAYHPGDVLDDTVPTWIVDPIDGTSNFAHRLPLFSISIGLRHQGVGKVGVIHAPAVGWTFAAAAEQGATLNGVPLEVSDRTALAEAIVACDWSRHPEGRRLGLAIFGALGEEAHTLRSMGSAALGFAAVAAGWTDIYFNYSLAPWDMAAGELLVREAGGRATALSGSPWRIEGGNVLVTNGQLHDAAQEVIAAHLPE